MKKFLPRTAIDVPAREPLAFMLVSLGGCDAQVEGHVAASLDAGNDRARPIDVLTQLLPFVGYPHTQRAPCRRRGHHVVSVTVAGEPHGGETSCAFHA